MVAKNFNYDVDLIGNEILNAILQNLSATPETYLKKGRFWFDTSTNKPMYYNGSAAKEFGKEYTEGTGIDISGSTISVDTSVIAQQSDIPTDYVPDTRKVNNKALSSDITLGASDVGAVPTSRKVNNKALSADITLSASDVGALADSTKYGATIDVSLNTTDYKLTITLKDQDGTALATKTVDFPVESVVVNGSYDSTNQKIVLTLVNGNTIDIPVGALISGLQSEITSSNKLSADLISDGTTNKTVTQTEKNTWNNKQNAIADLADIRAGAEAGATALQSISSSDVTTALGYTPCKKITAQNGALTASSGVCTWTITNSIGSADVLVQVRNASTGAVVEVAETITASTITIKLNSTSNIAANTYKAVIIG